MIQMCLNSMTHFGNEWFVFHSISSLYMLHCDVRSEPVWTERPGVCFSCCESLVAALSPFLSLSSLGCSMKWSATDRCCHG